MNLGSTNRHLLDVERRMHFEVSRTAAALSLSFILSITPWAFKEAVIACIEVKVMNVSATITSCNYNININDTISTYK